MTSATLPALKNENSIAAQVAKSLCELGYPQLTRLTCESDGSTVVLEGELNSFYMAQLALSVTSRVTGVRHIINRVKMI